MFVPALIVWSLLCPPIVIVIHELGHALMALAVRFRVFRIQLGIGRVWAEEASQLVERGHPVALEQARRYLDLAPEHPNAALLPAAALMNVGEFANAKHHS